MLLFNNINVETDKTLKVFQNISCYCLTKTIKKGLKYYNNFKTSHVIV